MRIVYLSQGKLYVKAAEAEPQLIESPFAGEVVQRQEQEKTNNAWKQRGSDGDGPLPPSMLWGRQGRDSETRRPAIIHVEPGLAADEILYVLRMSRSQGLFRRHLGRNEERRIMHRQEFSPVGLSACPRSGELVVAARTAEGLAHLELLDRDEHHQGTITGGDSFDSHPFHDPQHPGVVWFQSSGAGRTAEGTLVAFGPAHLNRLDQQSGTLTTVVELADKDCMCPQVDQHGTLYYLRRPWRAPGHVSAWGLLKDIVLFPFRVGRALIDFLNVFSLFFSKKPLKTAGGAPGPATTTGKVWLYGALIDVEDAARTHRGPDGTSSLVPRTWELVKRTAEGQETVLERGISSFAVAADGTVVCTDGFTVRRLGDAPAVLHRGTVIECLRLVP